MAGINQEFVASLEGWAIKTEDTLLAVLRDALGEVTDIAIDGTPVRTGLLAGSYNGVGYGKDASKSRIAQLIAGIQPGSTFVFFNNTEYAEYIEYGTDKIRPFAMMQHAAAEWPNCVARAAARRLAG